MSKTSDIIYNEALADFKDISQERKVRIYILIKNMLKMREAEKNFLHSRDIVDSLKCNLTDEDIDLADLYFDRIACAWDNLDISNFVLIVLFKESE